MDGWLIVVAVGAIALPTLIALALVASVAWDWRRLRRCRR
jgi:hypothetical protein